MERTERLLDLVALFLDAQEPISWVEIQKSFPDDYGAGSQESALRKFERDKAELLELGLPITYLQGDEDFADGYLVDKSQYYLPEVGLTSEELAVLYAAGSAVLASGAFPGKQDLAHALRKMGFLAGPKLPTPRVRVELGTAAKTPEVTENLEALWNAAASRKFVELHYYSPHSNESTRRRVSPYGLALRRGLWTLVGFCHLRNDVRTFHVHRVRECTVNTVKPKSPDFEVPSDFRLEDFVANYPWQYAFHAPVEVCLQLSGELAPLGQSLFPSARLEARGDCTRVYVRATDLEGLLKYALSLGAECRVQAPASAVEKHAHMAQRIWMAHGGGL